MRERFIDEGVSTLKFSLCKTLRQPGILLSFS